ncbi:YARHG domain-containing protein [Rubneribacter sp.]
MKKLLPNFIGLGCLLVLIGGLGFALVASTDIETTEPFSENRVDIAESEYVLPDSNTRYYTREELETLSVWELYVAHNEIYARHGRGFNREDLAAHFASCSWYNQLYTPEEYDALPSQLNEFERSNADLMLEIRHERNDEYL